MVLLKNEYNALPIKDKKQNIALFGNGSYVTNVGGSGSGFVMRAGPTVNIIDGLTNAGYSIEESTKQVYADYITENTPKQNSLQAIRGFIKRAAEMHVSLELAEKASDKADIARITSYNVCYTKLLRVRQLGGILDLSKPPGLTVTVIFKLQPI